MTHQDLQLTHTKTGTILVLFLEGKTEFYDRILEQEMENMGIYIPPMNRKDFEGRKYIFPSDPLFQKAFVEIYYPLSMDRSQFSWEKLH